jgi:hypothetical protein
VHSKYTQFLCCWMEMQTYTQTCIFIHLLSWNKLFQRDTRRVPEGYTLGITILNFFLLWYPESTHLVLVGYHSIILKIITAMVFTPGKALRCPGIPKITSLHPRGLLILGMLLPWGFALPLPSFSEDSMTHGLRPTAHQ